MLQWYNFGYTELKFVIKNNFNSFFSHFFLMWLLEHLQFHMWLRFFYYTALAKELVVTQLSHDFFHGHQSALGLWGVLFSSQEGRTKPYYLMRNCCFLPQNEGTAISSSPLSDWYLEKWRAEAIPRPQEERINTWPGPSFPGWVPAQQVPGSSTQRKPQLPLPAPSV